MKQQIESAEEAARRFVGQFLEQHDVCAVRVFFTMKGGGVISVRDIGDGDIYSIEGFVRHWLVKQEERVRISTRQEEKQEGDDFDV